MLWHSRGVSLPRPFVIPIESFNFPAAFHSMITNRSIFGPQSGLTYFVPPTMRQAPSPPGHATVAVAAAFSFEPRWQQASMPYQPAQAVLHSPHQPMMRGGNRSGAAQPAPRPVYVFSAYNVGWQLNDKKRDAWWLGTELVQHWNEKNSRRLVSQRCSKWSILKMTSSKSMIAAERFCGVYWRVSTRRFMRVGLDDKMPTPCISTTSHFILSTRTLCHYK